MTDSATDLRARLAVARIEWDTTSADAQVRGGAEAHALFTALAEEAMHELMYAVHGVPAEERTRAEVIFDAFEEALDASAQGMEFPGSASDADNLLGIAEAALAETERLGAAG